MRVLPVALLGLALAMAFPGELPADPQRISALLTLTDYWGTQTSSLVGWLGDGADPGFVPVVPPDSSLWSPGTLLLLSETEGFQQIGSRERFVPVRSVKMLGKERADTAVFDSLVFGAGEGQFRFEDLAGVLEAFAVVRLRSSTFAEDLRAELDRCGVRRVTLTFPDAQVHRLAPSDLGIYLDEEASETTRRLLGDSKVRVITSAVFLRTLQIRFDSNKNALGLIEGLERLLGTGLKLRSDGSLKLPTHGVYVAIQTGRYAVRTQARASGGEVTEPLLTDTTSETRDVLSRLLAGYDGSHYKR